MNLHETVQAWIEERAEGYDGALDDLLEHGCQSGMVSDLIYYCDTVAFYRRHKAEIDGLVKELGGSPSKLFRDWDSTDPFADDTHNQNLLAWFGFEETARRIWEGGSTH